MKQRLWYVVLLVQTFFFLSLRAYAAAPHIDYQPVSQSVVLYQPAGFGVIASGTPRLSYQWFKDSSPVAGATDDELLISKSQFTDNGQYAVKISNQDGSVTSAVAGLNIRLPRSGDVDFSFGHTAPVALTVRAISV